MIESDKKNFNDSHLYDEEIDLKELFNVVWEGKTLIILITSIVAMFSVVYALMLTNIYHSESILVARDSQDAGMLSQYEGLASMAGVGLPNSGDEGVVEIMEIIQSRKFVKHLMTFENVLPSIMAAKNYDAASQELYFNPEIYDGKTKTWIREPNNNKGIKPSYLETHKAYSGILSISHDKQTGLISMMTEHISPIFAKDLLALIIKEANTLNREKDIDESNKALNYLKIELSQTPLIEIKESINQLIQTQLETQMMAKISEDYSLVIIEPPFIPEEKSGPNRGMISVVGTMIGGILSMLIVLIRHYYVGKETINKHTIV